MELRRRPHDRRVQEKKDEKKEEPTEPKPLVIDFDGLAQRIARVPVEAEDYAWIAANKGNLLLLKGTPYYYGRSPDQETELQIFSMEDRKLETLVEGVSGVALSHDGAKVLVRTGGAWAQYDAKPKGKDSKKTISTKGLAADIVPQMEWATIFDEVWRRYRDFFYAKNMHGNDWEALRAQYRPWLDDVAPAGISTT
jgi:tricorn protease